MATVPVPRTWVTGEVVTAAELNGIRDALNFLLTPVICTCTYNGAGFAVATSTLTPVPFDTEVTDVDNMHSLVSNLGRFTPATPGIYFCEGGVPFANAATGTYRLLIWRINGTTFIGDGKAGPQQVAEVRAATAVYLNGTTDYVELCAMQDTGASMTIVPFQGGPRATVLRVSS